MTIIRRSGLVVALTLVGLFGAACSNNDGGGNDGGGNNAGGNGSPDAGGGAAAVNVTVKDFGIALDPTTVDAGDVKFQIQNAGPSIHEFVVFQTDRNAKNLPLTEDENGIPIVDEEGEGLEPVDEVEDIADGATETLSVNLDPGSYVAVCNLPGHYKQGMRVSFTVE
jgi:uncharacterized cupredoxin-like copper-binding protein